ncbi:MAG: electron transfer flavoprotein subunit alpha, partial [Acidobacteriota bacterium]
MLVLLHTESDGLLARSALETLGLARTLGMPFSVGLAGADVKAAADSIAACGATRFIGVAGAEFAQSRYATDAAAAEALAR